MKLALKIVGVMAFLSCLWNESHAQIIAITSDGKKVILNSDGTWKYEFENNGKKVILNPDGTWRYATAKDTSKNVIMPPVVPVQAPVPAIDSLKVSKRDSIKSIPVKPPV